MMLRAIRWSTAPHLHKTVPPLIHAYLFKEQDLKVSRWQMKRMLREKQIKEMHIEKKKNSCGWLFLHLFSHC
jgi:hypothetical protein